MSTRRSRLTVAAAAGLCALGVAVHAPVARGATSDNGAAWVAAPALAPPPPSGAQPPPYPVPVGYVSDIEFWAPNRGLLITRGNSVVPMGLYAYDGVNWHQLSTVCGGTDGRIAWAGPDEFWTIADQRPGQTLPSGGANALQDVSLCHFQNGAVVASYALPLDEPNSYQRMNAAACATPSDCWFGGALDSSGAFHLHWDGSNLTQVDAPQDHEIASMTVDSGEVFESVQLQPTDNYGSENPNFPPVLHVIDPTDPSNPFHSLYPDNTDPACGAFCPPLPEYGNDTNGNPVPPDALGGLAPSSDWRAGASDPQLWAAAGIAEPILPDGGSPHPIVLRFADGTWTQVVPNLVSLPGDESPPVKLGPTPVPQSVAAEPNESAAWIATQSQSDTSAIHVDRIQVNGTSSAQVTDDDVLGSGLGAPTAITCPAPADCWLATSQGWLFHLTNGTTWPQDTDPNFAGVITYRPPDGGTPSVIPPVDLSVSIPPPPTPVPTQPGPPTVIKRKPLVEHMSRARLIRGDVLELSFTLTAKAYIRLVARRDGKIVAETKRYLWRSGRHTIKLRLDPKRWPTKLSLKAIEFI